MHRKLNYCSTSVPLGCLHRIVTGDEKWVHYDNPKRKKSWCRPGEPSTSTAKANIRRFPNYLKTLKTLNMFEFSKNFT